MSVAAGDLAAARAYYEQGLAIDRTLADADPASAEKQRNLGVAYCKMFNIEKKLGNGSAARALLESCVAVWGMLEAEGRLPAPDDRLVLEYCRRQLAEWGD